MTQIVSKQGVTAGDEEYVIEEYVPSYKGSDTAFNFHGYIMKKMPDEDLDNEILIKQETRWNWNGDCISKDPYDSINIRRAE